MALPLLLSRAEAAAPPPAASSKKAGRLKKVFAGKHLFGEGTRAFALGDLAAAEASMLELLAMDELNVDAHALLVLIYDEKKDALKAFLHDRRRLELTEAQEVTSERLTACARRAWGAGKLSEAIAIAQQAVRLDRFFKDAILALCGLYVAAKEYARAIETCRQALDLAYDPNVLLIEARARVAMGDRQGALKILLQTALPVLAPVVPVTKAPDARIPADEEAAIATALSSLSGAVDLIMEAGKWNDARELIQRCLEFMETGQSADASVIWSWDLVPAAHRKPLRQRAMPIDLVVKHALCMLELGNGLQDVRLACSYLVKLPLTVDTIGPYEELHELVAATLVRYKVFDLAVELLKRVDSVRPLRHSTAHVERFALALESVGEAEYASEVKSRLQQAADGVDAIADDLQAKRNATVVLVPGWDVFIHPQAQEAPGRIFERVWSLSRGNLEGYVQTVAEAIGQSLDRGTLQACNAQAERSDVASMYSNLGPERFSVALTLWFESILTSCRASAVESLLLSCGEGECKLALASLGITVVPGFFAPVEYLLDRTASARESRPSEELLQAFGRCVQPDVAELQRKHSKCEWLMDLLAPRGKVARAFFALQSREDRIKVGLGALDKLVEALDRDPSLRDVDFVEMLERA